MIRTRFLRDRDLLGDLIDDERFLAGYVTLLDLLHRVGARRTLQIMMGEVGIRTPG